MNISSADIRNAGHGDHLSDTSAVRISPHTVELVMPWPPSCNRYYRHVGAKVLISAEGRAYRERVRNIAVGVTGLPMTGWLDVRIDAVVPDRRRRDVDNLQKPMLDALSHAGLWNDDYQVCHLDTHRHEMGTPGYVRVEILERNERS